MQPIVKWIMACLIICFFLQNAAFAAHTPFRLLITTFDPFTGNDHQARAKNNSQDVAAEIKQMLPTQLGKPIEIRICNLPVVYDVAANEAMKCIDEFQPDTVITLGENECDIRVETAATNQDNANIPDNSGQIRKGSAIIAGGPQRSGFMFPAQDLFCAYQPTNPPNTIVSSDPGKFVCNNTAYRLSEKLKTMAIPFTLIHVPNSLCSAEQVNPKTNAKTITKMLVAAIPDIMAHDASNYKSFTMPSTAQEAFAYSMLAPIQQAPSCAAFYPTLLNTYPKTFPFFP